MENYLLHQVQKLQFLFLFSKMLACFLSVSDQVEPFWFLS